MALQLRQRLESADVEVFMYDPDGLWNDPVTIVIEALIEVDCVASLNPEKRSPWVEAELEWAGECQRPVIGIDSSRVSAAAQLIREAPHAATKDIVRGDRFVRALKVLRRHLARGILQQSDFFTIEDWCLLIQVEPMIPDLNHFYAAINRDEPDVDVLANEMGQRIGHLFRDLECLTEYLNIASATHPLVFKGCGIPTTSSKQLAKLSTLTLEEMRNALPMGLKRLREIRDDKIKEWPRI